MEAAVEWRVNKVKYGVIAMWFALFVSVVVSLGGDAPPVKSSETKPTAEEGAGKPAEDAAPEAKRGLTSYMLQPKSSVLAVITEIDKSTMLSSMGHDHAIVASSFDGRVEWDPTDASKCKVEISFPVTALVVDPGDIRTRFGLDGETTSDGDKSKITSNFLGKSQLDSARHSQVSFAATQCSGVAGKVKVTGALTIRGVSKTVSTEMDISEDGEAFMARGTFTANHTDFGFNPFSAAFGALKNSNQMTFRVDVRGTVGKP